ncbi:DUF6493 family protein [Nonomuraea sp. NPDC023979]|uniref:DUF7824 domain-containing protein n=1 Tax=Nonomuraea sp. NPDC023979 TaxID=3154796 RepID=UPI0033F14E95
MDHWGEIRKLIEARRPDRVAEKVAALDGAARQDVAARLPGLLKELRGRFDRWDDGLIGYAAALRVAGAATIGGAAAVAAWLLRRDFTPRWGRAEPGTRLVLAVLADRPAAWRADLAERLALRVRAGDEAGAALALAVLGETGIEPPHHDPLVAAWVTRGADGLADDPLLDHLLPRLFEATGVGRALQWDSTPGAGWLGALTALAEAGRIKREALIEGCVRRFLLGGSAVDLRFFVRLHEALDPAPAETAPHARDYRCLLASAPGPVAELAMKRLRRVTGLSADDLGEAWESLLFRAERKLVRGGLSWLERSVRHEPSLAAVAAAPLARAFAADSAELREKAVELVLACAGGMDEEGRAAVREAVGLLPAGLGRQVAETVGGGEVAQAEPVFTPPPLPSAPARSQEAEPPIETVEELGRLLMAGAPRSWQAWERLLAGFVTLAYHDRAGVAAEMYPRLFSSSVDDYRSGEWTRPGQWLLGAARSLSGTAPARGVWQAFLPRRVAVPHLLLLHRGAEVLRAVEDDTLPPLLLATPTHTTGHVAAAELVRRMEVLEAAGARPPAADLQQALLRLPRTPDPDAAERASRLTSAAGRMVAAWTCPEAEVGLAWECGSANGDHDCHRRHGHTLRPVVSIDATATGLPLVDAMLSLPWPHSQAEHCAWWPSTLPSHREVAAAHLMPHLLTRGWGPLHVGAEQARQLARAEGPAGEACAAVLARVLGDPELPESVGVLLEAAARDELPAAGIGRQAGLMAAQGTIRLTDLTAALDAAASQGAHAHVWRIAAAALPLLLPRPGERPRHGLAAFVALAGAAAGWSGARGEIPEVRDLAARKGAGDLLRAIRALHDRLTAQEG